MKIRCIHCGDVLTDQPSEQINQLIARHLERCEAARDKELSR